MKSFVGGNLGTIVAGVIFLAMANFAQAHPEGFSGLRVLVTPGNVRAILTLHTRDMGSWFPPGKYPNYVADVTHAMEAQPGELLDLRADGELLTAAKIHSFAAEVGLIETDIDYPLPAGAKHLEIWSKHLVLLPRGHQQLLSVESNGQTLGEQTLTVEEDAAGVDLPSSSQAPTRVPTTAATSAPAPPSPAAGQRISFVALGIKQSLTGYDHLLFLAALILVCRNLREAAVLVTIFTAAISTTLVLVALNFIHLPGRIIAPAIAASIVYVAIDNIFGRPKFIWRAAVAFGFGLVHGLGFALARHGDVGGLRILPLLKISAGLLTGQLCLAAIFLRLLLTFRRRDGYETYLVRACSVLVSLLGGFWLVTRVLQG